MNGKHAMETKKVLKTSAKIKKNISVKKIRGTKVKSGKHSTDSTVPVRSTIPAADNKPLILAYDESCRVTQSISEFVRQEVTNAMMTGIFRRGTTQKPFSKDRYESLLNECNSDYVKLDDLKDIVNQLISRNLVESVVKANTIQVEETSKQIGNRLLTIEEDLKTVKTRITEIEQSVSGVQHITEKGGIARAIPRVQANNNLPYASSSMPQISNIFKIRLPSQKNTPLSEIGDDLDKEDCKIPAGYVPKADGKLKDEKECVYDELIRKYNRHPGGKERGSVKQVDLPRKQSHEARQRDDLQRRVAERRIFETNMLLYQKSPFTLQLNKHKDHFPNELRIPRAAKPTQKAECPTQSHHKYPIRPRLARGELPKSTEESESDWLFEQ
ncbi:hypothetical protein KR009_009081 [Drosophila setifemur]|nr:hypothetical protein KR009_009081 [Drosophila setifemur]